jgi:hypothetical protein
MVEAVRLAKERVERLRPSRNQETGRMNATT